MSEWEDLLDALEARNARCVDYICAYGYCIWEYDPVTKQIVGGMGAQRCKCTEHEDDSLRLYRRLEKH